ncbi:TPA: GTP cyclohydrolase II [Candidatus Woesearchaeota archaeon]|nr:MAG: GTP cyclohydrolase-2 [archaeon GW2011_AR11]HIH04944.1 GTP cyclohydrolase II [Candidatus Woesearchaeota archaeon]HIH91839.1 GTP cyclohydrolase II [Candidatus Woesearchaeota archaeon]HII65009.1 GTP cyclohydrolase II [Candidatus Woesearchaeota archaeon]
MQNGVRLLLPSKTAEFLKYGKFSTLMASLVKHKAEATLPTVYGKFRIHVFEDGRKKEHTALVKGKLSRGKPALARIHSQCLTGDTLGSTKCDCGLQLRAALGMIGKQGGVLVYLQQEGRGIGLANKIKAYALQDKGMDTVEANEKLGFRDDARDYSIGAAILHHLGVKKIRLLTNNPRKIGGLQDGDIEIAERVPLIPPAYRQSKGYMKAKRQKLGHLLGE